MNTDNGEKRQEVEKSALHKFKHTPFLPETFLQLCLDEVATSGYQGSSMKSASWKKVIDGLNEEFGILFDQKQLKNRWDNERRKYTLWRTIIGKSGGGVNHLCAELHWPNHVWDDIIKKNPKAKKFKGKPLENAELLYKLFEQTVTAGDYEWTPASEGLPNDGDGVDPPMMVEDDPSENVDGAEVNGDSYWSNISFDGSIPVTPSSGNTNVKEKSTDGSSKNGKKRRKNMDTGEEEIQKVVTMLSEQFEYYRMEKDAKKEEESAEKKAKKAYSVPECIAAVGMLKTVGSITESIANKATPKLIASKEYREAFMVMQNFEDKEEFIKTLVEI